MLRFFLFLWCIVLYGVETDFDYVVVGTSPLSLFEALCKRGEGHRVVVVEQATECGGAWKSLTLCGVPRADLGCHEFGCNLDIKKFLEEYAGCRLISTLENGEFYPAGGCYELIHNLEHLMQVEGVIVWLNQKLESLYLDTDREIAEVFINGMRYTTHKVLLSNNSNVKFENPQIQVMYSPKAQVYPHLYLLIADEAPPRFTYRNLGVNGASRVMNLTPFVGLEGTGKQLIALQVQNESCLQLGQSYLNELRKQDLISAQAQILCQESTTYKQMPFNRNLLHTLGEPANKIVEFIETGQISNLSTHIERWKKVLKPWKQVI